MFFKRSSCIQHNFSAQNRRKEVKMIKEPISDMKPEAQLPNLYKISIHDILFILLTIFYFIFAFHLYYTSKGFPGFTNSNVDEIYFTYLAAFNFYHFGPSNSGFLPDYASGLDPSAHPYVYTHNIAFPNWVGYFLMLLGFTKVQHFSFISIFLSYVGYSAGYLFFRKYVSRGAAILLFFLILANYQDVLTHSLGFFRPFQWILFFTVPYLFFQWSEKPESRIRIILFFFSLLFAVSYEYTFAFKLYILIILLYLFNVYGCKNLISLRRLLFIMLAAFLIPRSLQFIMVWRMFGFETTFYDQIATIANRMLSTKNPQKLVDYFSERGILFWVYGDKPGFVEGVKSLLKAIMSRYGIIPVASALAVIFLHIGTISLGNKEDKTTNISKNLWTLFTQNIKKINNRDLIKYSLIHTLLVWVSLLFAYNSYREWMKNVVGTPISADIKSNLKASFPDAIFAFVIIYLMIILWQNRKIGYLSFKQYAILFVFQAVLINVLFYSGGRNILIVQNLSLLYLTIILFLGAIVKRFIIIYEDIIEDVGRKIENILIKSSTYISKKLKSLIPMDSVVLVSCMILSFLVYIVFFYTHTHMVNIGSFVPLIEMYTISAISLVIYLVYQFILKKTGSIYFCTLFFVAIIFMQFNQFIYAYYHNPPLPMAAYDVLPKYNGKSFITSYHSVYPTIFTKHWVIPNWSDRITPENVQKSNFISDYIWLKDKKSPEGQRYSNAEYYLHIYRLFARPIDIRMKDTFEIVEKGDNYEIYKLR